MNKVINFKGKDYVLENMTKTELENLKKEINEEKSKILNRLESKIEIEE